MTLQNKSTISESSNWVVTSDYVLNKLFKNEFRKNKIKKVFSNEFK